MAKKSRADRKKEAEKKLNASNNKQQETNVKKASEKKETEKKQYTYEPQEAPKLTLYTTCSMIAVLGGAIATAMSMIMLAKPVEYIVYSYYGGYEDSMFLNMFKNEVLSKNTQSDIVTMFTIIAVLVVVATILSLIDVTKVLNPKNKPALVVSIMSFVLSAVALGLYIYESIYVDGKFEVYYVEYESIFNIYKWLMVGLIVNAVFMMANVIGNAIGYSKWKKTRKAY